MIADGGHRAARPRQTQCERERLLVADRLDRHVRQPAAGEAADFLDHVVDDVEGDVGAHPHRELAARCDAVDDDDRRSASEPRRDGGGHSDRTLADDRNDVAEAQVGSLDGTEAGGADAAEHHRLLVGHAGRDRCEVRGRVRHDGVLRMAPVAQDPELEAVD